MVHMDMGSGTVDQQVVNNLIDDFGSTQGMVNGDVVFVLCSHLVGAHFRLSPQSLYNNNLTVGLAVMFW